LSQEVDLGRNIYDRLALRDHQVDAQVHACHADRHDQGIQFQPRYQEAVNQAEDGTRQEAQAEGQERIDVKPNHEDAAEYSGKSRDRANREIQLPEDQQACLSHRDHARKRH
jgi:hypothetical protein